MNWLFHILDRLWAWIDPPRICQHCGFDQSDHHGLPDWCPDGSGERFKLKEGEP